VISRDGGFSLGCRHTGELTHHVVGVQRIEFADTSDVAGHLAAI
jgi:hypothetical protein